MTEAIKNRTMAQAWRLLWQHKILWVYVPIFYFFEYLVPSIYAEYVSVPTRYVSNFFLAVAISIILVLITATFYKNALSWINDFSSAFLNSFKLGRKAIILIFWGTVLGVITAIQHDFPLIFRWLDGLTVMWFFVGFVVLKLLFMVCTVYVVVILVSSKASLLSSVKRSFLFVKRTWLLLLAIAIELFLYLLLFNLVILAFNIIWVQISGAQWTFGALFRVVIAKLWFYQITPFFWVILGLLFYGAISILYQRQIIQGYEEIVGEIPPYTL